MTKVHERKPLQLASLHPKPIALSLSLSCVCLSVSLCLSLRLFPCVSLCLSAYQCVRLSLSVSSHTPTIEDLSLSILLRQWISLPSLLLSTPSLLSLSLSILLRQWISLPSLLLSTPSLSLSPYPYDSGSLSPLFFSLPHLFLPPPPHPPTHPSYSYDRRAGPQISVAGRASPLAVC